MAPCLCAGAPPLHIIHCKTRDMPELSPQEDGTAMILSDGLTTPHQEWDNVGGLPTNNLYYPPGHKLYCSLEISIIHIPTAIHPGKFPELLEWAGDSFLTKVAETLIGNNSLLDLLLPYQKKHASTEQPLVQILQGNLKISKNAKKVRAVRTLDNLEQTSVCLKNHWMKSSGKRT